MLSAQPFYIYSFDGWSTVGGIQMLPRDGTTTLHFLINPDVDPKLFETAPDNVTREDAWKKFLRK
jgi:CubicO group peptidase (beta-lactamase class C family)